MFCGGAVSKLRFGITEMKNNGCEVIAAYNALKTLGKPQDIRAIAYSFETDGQMLLGAFGTNPYAVGRYFEKIGYNVKTIEGDDILTKPTPKADAYIVSFWNSDDVTDALHTVAARKTENGEYEVFNYGGSEYEKTQGSNEINELLRDDLTVPILLHCISK